jgi:hypothetical protein
VHGNFILVIEPSIIKESHAVKGWWDVRIEECPSIFGEAHA